MKPIAPVTLTGRHVRLEPLSHGHAAALVAAANGARDTYGLTNVPQHAEEMAAYIDAALAGAAAGNMVPFATVRVSDGRVVGSTRFGNIEYWSWLPGDPRQRPAGCPDAVEIGWTWLAADAQRSGVNTDAKILMIDHAFAVWEVHRVTLKTDSRNQRSRNAIQRIGGQLDGVLRAHMPAFDGAVRDSAVYSILAAEWPAHRARLAARLLDVAAPNS